MLSTDRGGVSIIVENFHGAIKLVLPVVLAAAVAAAATVLDTALIDPAARFSLRLR